MSDTIRSLISAARAARGWSYGDLAEAVGKRRDRGGAIADLEREEVIDVELLEKVADALEIDPETLDAAIDDFNDRLRAEWHRSLQAAFDRPHVAWKAIPGFWVVKYPPPEIQTEEELEQWALQFAYDQAVVHRSVYGRTYITQRRITSRRELTDCEPDLPYIKIGRKKVRALFTS